MVIFIKVKVNHYGILTAMSMLFPYILFLDEPDIITAYAAGYDKNVEKPQDYSTVVFLL